MPPNAYRLHAQSHGNWEVVARQAACPTTACAVQAYESAQYDWDNRPGEETISDIRQLTSAFSQRMPTGSLAANGFDAEAAYDIWPNRYGLEVMIWVDTQGQTPAGSRIGSANLGGTRYAVFRGGRTYTFLAGTNVTSGTVNSGDALDWLVAQAGVAGSSYLTQFNFGWEICSTAGKTALFRVTRLDLRQRFA